MQIDPVHILLVEDNPVDVEMVRRALRKNRLVNPLVVAGDGLEALQLLRTEPTTIPSPRLVLLDLNMPRMSGLEFLREIRADARLKSLVVFVLTTSQAEEDLVASYNLNVAGYVVKGRVGEGSLELVRLLDSYWSLVAFPPPVKPDR